MSETRKQFEYLLLNHCAPTLYGAKSANLFSIQNRLSHDLPRIIRTYIHQFRPFGVELTILCSCNNSSLVYVYRKEELAQRLSNPSVQEFLHNCGYSDFSSLESVLDALKARVSEYETFPHEIGIFLDYPLADVKGFIANNGKNFKLSGYWKVYENEHKAACLFDKYTECRRDACKKHISGLSVMEIMQSA